MASQQPNAWQTANRSRNSASNSASRTPQSRSGTQSPNQSSNTAQTLVQDGARVQQPQINSVWTQRSSTSGGTNGQARSEVAASAEETFESVNGFNAAEVKEFLGRDVGSVAVYKPAEVVGTGTRGGSGTWGPSSMANGQPFFVQLAKQVATIEGGG